ncbi:MAG: hypothetical protein VX986_01975 [Pseudomonadota bacterium]|nr:hypothetical protein [Pseudomonadota bacterium]
MNEPFKLKDMIEYETVQTWLSGLEKHWGGEPATDDPDRLPTLEEFCKSLKVEPDKIIKECKRINKAGDPRISVKGRRKYSELIDEFQDGSQGSRMQRAKRGNIVRSFLIHNAILLSPGALKGGED